MLTNNGQRAAVAGRSRTVRPPAGRGSERRGVDFERSRQARDRIATPGERAAAAQQRTGTRERGAARTSSARAIARTRSGVDTLSASATKCTPDGAGGASIAASSASTRFGSAEQQRRLSIAPNGSQRRARRHRPAPRSCLARRTIDERQPQDQRAHRACRRATRSSAAPPRACCARTHRAVRRIVRPERAAARASPRR